MSTILLLLIFIYTIQNACVLGMAVRTWAEELLFTFVAYKPTDDHRQCL